MFVYESLARRRSRAARHDRLVVERERREAVDRMPGRVGGHGGIEVARDEAEVGRRELPASGLRSGSPQGLELLEVGELPDVDLRREVAADRLLERLGRLERRPGERPGARVRVPRALPEQYLEPPSRTCRTAPRRRGRCFRSGAETMVDSRT